MRRILMWAAASVLITLAAPVERVHGAAQRQWQWGSGATPQAGVCFFDDKNFKGRQFCVRAGEDVAQVPREINDEISSLRVIGNVEVMVFKDTRFRGPSGRFLTDVKDLRKEGWNDQISSVRVGNASQAWDRRQFPAFGRQAPPREGACFYRDTDYRGDYFCLPRGAAYSTVSAGFNDQISSIRIISATGVLIFTDHDFDGASARVTSDVPDLRRGVWNDRISSIRVY